MFVCLFVCSFYCKSCTVKEKNSFFCSEGKLNCNLYVQSITMSVILHLAPELEKCPYFCGNSVSTTFPCQPAMLVNSFVNSCKYNLICLFSGIPQDAQNTAVWNVSEGQTIWVACTHGVLIAPANCRLRALTCRVSQSVLPGSLSSVVTELVCSS
jgi:hypothetical protein